MCKPLFLSLNANPSASLQVNIAQGLVHMGKGLLTLKIIYHSDHFLLSKYVQTIHYCILLQLTMTLIDDATISFELTYGHSASIACGVAVWHSQDDVIFAWELRFEIYHSWQIPLSSVFPWLGDADTLTLLSNHLQEAWPLDFSVIHWTVFRNTTEGHF